MDSDRVFWSTESMVLGTFAFLVLLVCNVVFDPWFPTIVVSMMVGVGIERLNRRRAQEKEKWS